MSFLKINKIINFSYEKKISKNTIHKFIVISLLSLLTFINTFQYSHAVNNMKGISPQNPKQIKNTLKNKIKHLQKITPTSMSYIKEVSSNQANVKSLKNQKNNTLSKEKIKYYQEKIGDKYKIINNSGRSGYWATSYELEDENKNKFILKIPNNPAHTKDWIERQKSADEKIKKYYKNYDGSLKITNYVTIGDDFVIEKNWGQQIGKEDFWESLSQEEVLKFINGMAEFLKFTHNQEKGTVSPIKIEHESFKFEDVCSYLSKAGAINPEEQKMILNMVETFRNRNTRDEITCLVHEDIRYQNIVYDAQSKQFALIDFDSLDVGGKIYWGFISRSVAINGIPYSILSKIIDKYNEISNVKVNKEKIKMFHKLGTLFEIVSFSKFKHIPKIQTDILGLPTSNFDEFGDNITSETICHEVWPMIKRRFEEIDKGFST